MRHHLRQPYHFGRHAVDENPVVQLQPDRKIQLRRQGERLLEVGARNRMPGHDAAVTHQAVGAVERRHAVVGNRLQIGQIGRRAPRGDEQLHAARMGLTQRLERRSGHPVGLEADQRSVDVQKYRFRHKCLFFYLSSGRAQFRVSCHSMRMGHTGVFPIRGLQGKPGNRPPSR